MKNIFFLLFFSFLVKSTYSQNTVITPTKIEANSNTNAILITRLSWQAISGISNPENGTLVYDTTNKILRMFNGQNWIRFKSFGTDIIPIAPFSFSRKEEENRNIFTQKQASKP